MDRSKRIKLIVQYYCIMRQQFDTLMLNVLVCLYIYIRNRRGHSVRGQKIRRVVDRNSIQESRMSLNAFALSTFDDEDGSVVLSPSTYASSSEQTQSRPRSSKMNNDYELLENLVDIIKVAMENQRKQVQVLANAISGVNEEHNLSRTLGALGFTSQEIVQIAIKFAQNPEMMKAFWSLDEQKKDFVRAIMEK